MKRALITGGTGFVGSWMKKTQPPDIFGVYLSHGDYDEMKWELHKWDYLIHLAPISPQAILNHIHNRGGRLLYCSSGAVYHEHPDQYGLNKISWEQMCRESCKDYVIARLFSFYGEGLDDGKAITIFAKNIREGKPIRIFGDGNTIRSYMGGQEMGQWMWQILLKGKLGEAYDVGSDEPVSMLQLARWLMIAMGKKVPIILENRAERVPIYLPRDTAKTRRLFNE